jgi:hypothetical protein
MKCILSVSFIVILSLLDGFHKWVISSGNLNTATNLKIHFGLNLQERKHSFLSQSLNFDYFTLLKQRHAIVMSWQCIGSIHVEWLKRS